MRDAIRIATEDVWLHPMTSLPFVAEVASSFACRPVHILDPKRGDWTLLGGMALIFRFELDRNMIDGRFMNLMTRMPAVFLNS